MTPTALLHRPQRSPREPGRSNQIDADGFFDLGVAQRGEVLWNSDAGFGHQDVHRSRISDEAAHVRWSYQVGGQPAQCVSVPVSGGTKVWCALECGPLASYQGPDVVITLTSFAPAGDEALFARTG